MSWFSDQWNRFTAAMDGVNPSSSSSSSLDARNTPVERVEVVWNRERFMLSVHPPAPGVLPTLRELKTLVSARTGVPVPQVKLIHNGLILKDDAAPLGAFGLKNGSRIILVGTSGGAPDIGDKAGSRGASGAGRDAVGARSKGEQLAREKRAKEEDTSEEGLLSRIEGTLSGIKRDLLNEVEALERAAKSKQAKVDAGEDEPGTNKQSPLVHLHRKVSELLVRALLNLDGVPVHTDKTRAARKDAVKEVQALLDRVDASWSVLKG